MEEKDDRNPIIKLKDLYFSYDKADPPVLKGLNLSIKRHTFTSILGSSGSGKTTLLKLFAGFFRPTSGSIEVSGSVSLMFQDYALFPHLTVLQNILYGLRLQRREKGISRSEKRRSDEKIALQMARLLGIMDFLDRYPNELSGGQQQRVSLARILVLKTDIILMDEPLSSLDEQLRLKLRSELRTLQKHLKLTIVYVTHDRDEALSMSDEIALLNEGEIMQVATPHDIYFHPADKFTASFLGGANFITDPVTKETLLVRPEWITLSSVPRWVEVKDKARLLGTIIEKTFCGAMTYYKIQTKTAVVTATVLSVKGVLEVGSVVTLDFLSSCVL